MPVGGEIVFIRADLRAGDQRPLRLLCEVMRPEGLCAVLLEPSLPTHRALTAGWSEQELVLLQIDGEVVGRDRLLVPAFPLADGTEDPGWEGYQL